MATLRRQRLQTGGTAWVRAGRLLVALAALAAVGAEDRPAGLPAAAADLHSDGTTDTLTTNTASAQASAEDDQRNIPALSADVLDPLWPTLAPRLPRGIATAGISVDAGGGNHTVSASAWIGLLAHPSAGLSWGLALGASAEAVDDGPGIPRHWHALRLVGGCWWHPSFTDQVLVLAAPGIGWSEAGAGLAWTVPVVGLYLHRSSRHLIWGVGAVALVWPGRPLLLPLAGALITDGQWTTLLSPVLVSSDHLLSGNTSIGVAGSLTGNAAPSRWGGAAAAAVTWEARLVVRGTWTGSSHLTLTGDAGWLPLRHALVTSRGATVLDQRLQPGPTADASLLLTW